MSSFNRIKREKRLASNAIFVYFLENEFDHDSSVCEKDSALKLTDKILMCQDLYSCKLRGTMKT